MVWLYVLAGGPAVGEGDGERVQRGLPRVVHRTRLAGRGQRLDGQVQAPQRGTFVGEVTSRPDRSTEPRVETLDRVRRTDRLMDFHIVVEKRNEPIPRVKPQAAHSRVFGRPLVEHLVASLFRGCFVDDGVDGFRVAFEYVPVLSGHIVERIAQQVKAADGLSGDRGAVALLEVRADLSGGQAPSIGATESTSLSRRYRFLTMTGSNEPSRS